MLLICCWRLCRSPSVEPVWAPVVERNCVNACQAASPNLAAVFAGNYAVCSVARRGNRFVGELLLKAGRY